MTGQNHRRNDNNCGPARNGVFCLSGSRISELPNGLLSLETVPPGTEFLEAETGGQESTRESVVVGRDRELKNRREESPQKRPLFDRRWFPRFGQTGWWCAQSYANPSPCYLANIRVIFEKNRE